MRSYERRVDATGSSDLEGELQTAVTVHLPDAITGPATIFFGWPGGGFGRRYFDVQVVPGYSQAAFHTESGDVFVSCDHLATGDSTHPADVLSLTYEQLAAASHATAIAILGHLSHAAARNRPRSDRRQGARGGGAGRGAVQILLSLPW